MKIHCTSESVFLIQEDHGNAFKPIHIKDSI